MANTKIYLASPFFTDKETLIVATVEQILRRRGYEVFSPREHEVRNGAQVGTPEWSKEMFLMDVNAILDCDVMVMLYHGNYSDSGTAWEAGFAYGCNTPVVVVQLSDLSNIMIHSSSDINITFDELHTYDFDTTPEKIYIGNMT